MVMWRSFAVRRTTGTKAAGIVTLWRTAFVLGGLDLLVLVGIL
jgi:hypothetical protein